MSKGTLLTNNWVIMGITLAILAAIVTVSLLQGRMAVELGGLELSFTPHEEGGFRLAVLRADHLSSFLPL